MNDLSPNTLQGTVEKVLFSNPDNGYAVCRLTRKDGQGEAVISGLLEGVAPGEILELEGAWEMTKHGHQFLVRSHRPILPTTTAGMIKYLGGGLIPGIGKKTAERIVEHFGEETFEVLDKDPKRFREIAGLGRKRVQTIVGAWKTRKSERDLGVFLNSVGLSAKLAKKILSKFGDDAARVIRDNPYELALQITGIGFPTADKIAATLGISGDSPQRAVAGAVHVLHELAGEGHSGCPRAAFIARCAALLEVRDEVMEDAVDDLSRRGLVYVDRSTDERDAYVFLKPLSTAEIEVAASLRTLACDRGRLRDFDEGRARDWLKKKFDPPLSDGQALAVIAAAKNKVLVITGGPGTGKTTIVRAIVEMLAVLKGEVILAAPTGRAAKRLSDATGREAKTLHRLLELRPGTDFHHKPDRLLDPDVMIIDESSMVDLPMMSAIMRSLAPSAHLVLVGDVDQLPSVGPGSVLKDIIECGRFPVQRLTEIFRQDEAGLIVVNAHRILQGRELLLPDGKAKSEFYFFRRDNPAGALNTIVDLAAERLPRGFGLDPFTDIQVVSPMHKGVLGVKSLNDALQERLNPHGASLTVGYKTFREGDRVLQTANDYDRDVFNGDLGRVAHVDPSERRMIVDFDGRRVVADGAKLDDLVPAYAISIHKSQGSEYPAVIMPLAMEHFIMLQRNLLYTAVTRARKLVVLVGSPRALKTAIGNNRVGLRYGLLKERLGRV